MAPALGKREFLRFWGTVRAGGASKGVDVRRSRPGCLWWNLPGTVAVARCGGSGHLRGNVLVSWPRCGSGELQIHFF